jgi:hypothetical protein
MNVFSRAAPKKGSAVPVFNSIDTHHQTGENFELRADLNSEYRDKRKDAIKRVIANMTVGKGTCRDLSLMGDLAQLSPKMSVVSFPTF